MLPAEIKVGHVFRYPISGIGNTAGKVTRGRGSAIVEGPNDLDAFG
ncbi:hypothetical protein ABID19_006241 [Mesorhizobium robiniae]|uniref:MOSC domain-containing protein n=1 Tax=Mesorhizobium robiniae TaxID=559315 RepID=A0ABV2GYS6_9HYPH